MARAFVKIFTIVFVAAAFFGLLAKPGLIHTAIADTTGLVKTVQGR